MELVKLMGGKVKKDFTYEVSWWAWLVCVGVVGRWGWEGGWVDGGGGKVGGLRGVVGRWVG